MDRTTMSYHDIMQLLNAQSEAKNLTAKEELIEYNVTKELKLLNGIMKSPLFKSSTAREKLFDMARYNILQYIVTCVNHDEKRGDFYSEANRSKLKEAGKMLYEYGGTDAMHDDFTWSFIPRRYHGEINLCWNGIGEWIA